MQNILYRLLFSLSGDQRPDYMQHDDLLPKSSRIDLSKKYPEKFRKGTNAEVYNDGDFFNIMIAYRNTIGVEHVVFGDGTKLDGALDMLVRNLDRERESKDDYNDCGPCKEYFEWIDSLYTS
ncbi:hypothetical protein H6504_04245 [Candidatus Woesearchaeota archaeon]|nr:hypothetical protein [Candidatus Woesearchaeota archaeon]